MWMRAGISLKGASGAAMMAASKKWKTGKEALLPTSGLHCTTFSEGQRQFSRGTLLGDLRLYVYLQLSVQWYWAGEGCQRRLWNTKTGSIGGTLTAFKSSD